MKNISIVLFAAAIFAFIFSLGFYFFMMQPLQTHTFFASVRVTPQTVGFDVNGTALTFGYVSAGGSSVRRVLLENSYSFPIRVNSAAAGSIAPFITVETPVIVEPHKSVYIPVLLNADLAEVSKNYNGTVSFTLLRAR